MALKIDINGRELRAKFYHSQRDKKDPREPVFDWEQAAQCALQEGQIDIYDGPIGNEDPFNGLTVCEIVDHDVILARGFAFCSSRDQFCRKTGRQVSLGRALKDLARKE